MEPVFIVILLVLIEYLVLGGLVGRARGAHNVKAPATIGSEPFERTYRTQQNTLENIVVFIPAIWIFGTYISPLWATVLGVIFLVGRTLYAVTYITAADKRGPGFAISALSNMALVVGALFGVIRSLI